MPKEKGILYIPRTISLPGPFKVKVSQIAPMQMKTKHGEFCDAVWDIDTMTVDINRKLTHQRKWFVFSHEYVHVVNDWINFLVNNEVSKG